MVVDRLGLAMLALGATGILWLSQASPASPERSSYKDCDHCGVAQAEPIEVMCSTDGGTPEAMQGPFTSLGEAAGRGELDVKIMIGVAPFEQLTVLHVGNGSPDLTEHDRLVLVVQVGGLWYTRELASMGPFCGGMGSPTWVDAEAAAPRIVDGAASVRVHETFRQGDSERTADTLVECRIDP